MGRFLARRGLQALGTLLLAEAGASFRRAPHLVMPGTFLVVATGALVLLAEAVRDARPPS